jgi:hypothetical protein
MGLEDWDFWLRVASRGGNFVHLPKIGFDYRLRRDSMIVKTAQHTAELANYVFGKPEMACYKLLRKTDAELQILRRSRTHHLGRGLLAPARLLRKLWGCFH